MHPSLRLFWLMISCILIFSFVFSLFLCTLASGFCFVLLAYINLSLSSPAFTFLSSVEWLMVTMAVYGFGVGSNFSIFTIVIVNVMGVEYLGPVYGCACFFTGIFFISFCPFLGKLDNVWLYFILSSMTLRRFRLYVLVFNANPYTPVHTQLSHSLHIWFRV